VSRVGPIWIRMARYCSMGIQDRASSFIFSFVRVGLVVQAFYDQLKFRELLKWIHSTFDSNKYPIYVTENGMSTNNADLTNGTDFDPNLEDGFRIEFYNGEYLRYFSISNQQKLYFSDYIGQMHRAMTEDNVNVEGYTGWV